MTCVKVADGDMDGDDLEGSMEADNGDCQGAKRYMMKAGNNSTLSQKGRRLYGKRLEVDNNKNSQDEIREACSGTEGQKLGAAREKFEIEVTNKKASKYSHGQWKRSKKVLFDRGAYFSYWLSYFFPFFLQLINTYQPLKEFFMNNVLYSFKNQFIYLFFFSTFGYVVFLLLGMHAS